MIFRNTQHECLSFVGMCRRILDFIRDEPGAAYRIAIGTDSQVKQKSHFVTGVIVHRVGKGAIGFIKEKTIARNIKSLREKISLETALTQEVACLFTPSFLDEIYEIMLSQGHNDHLNLEIHLDIGQTGPTRELIKEMVTRVSGMGFDVKIKPFAVAASSFANRYTK